MRREDVHSADNKHVVRPSEAFSHSHKRTATIARINKQPGEISCTVAQEWHRFFRYGSENELPYFTVRKCFQCLRIDNLGDKMVFENVVPLLTFTFHGHSRTDNFAQPVYIVGFYIQQIFNLSTHFICPRLRPENPHAQFYLFRRYAFFKDTFTQMSSIRGCAGDNGSVEIGHELKLFPGVAGRNRNNRRPYFFGTVMQSKTSSKRSVTVSNLNSIVFINPSHSKASGNHFRPNLQIPVRISHNRRLSCCSA
ncbi:hypothetical protein SDC9_131117 [bioreactor metagenome]|uniref:Uncharacterized protein n=1 Tax=bioreactor metagenome TaxID=1076179 RepID=A0A645D3U3_9ZZZZ